MSDLWVYSLGTALGSESVDATQLVDEFGPVRDGFLDRTGFTTVYRSTAEETSLSLAVAAISAAPRDWWVDQVDALISVGSTANLVAPGNAHLLQTALGLPGGILTLDVNDACTGFVRSLYLADSLLASGAATTVLLVLADTYSKLYKPDDLKVSPLFSDGASALIISANELPDAAVPARRWELLGRSFASEGANAGELCIARTDDDARPEGQLTMNGAAVLNFVLRTLPRTLSTLETTSGIATTEVDEWFVHQGSRAVVTAVEKKVQAAPGSLFRAEEYGNTVGSSIPFQLAEDSAHGAEQTVGMLAFGVGLTIGGLVVRQRAA